MLKIAKISKIISKLDLATILLQFINTLSILDGQRDAALPYCQTQRIFSFNSGVRKS